MKIYAFDPGATTGFCLLYAAPEHFDLLMSHEVTMWEQWYDIGELLRLETDVKVVVVESFHLFEGAARHLIHNEFPAAQKIGVIEYLSWAAQVAVHYQAPSIKNAFPDKELRGPRVGFKLPASPHVKDAMRHAVYYFYDQVWQKQRT